MEATVYIRNTDLHHCNNTYSLLCACLYVYVVCILFCMCHERLNFMRRKISYPVFGRVISDIVLYGCVRAAESVPANGST